MEEEKMTVVSAEPQRDFAAEAEQLRQENAVLRQNADAANRAPVRGVTGGGDTASRPRGAFLQGLREDVTEW